jgi:hypothetical protein
MDFHTLGNGLVKICARLSTRGRGIVGGKIRLRFLVAIDTNGITLCCFGGWWWYWYWYWLFASSLAHFVSITQFVSQRLVVFLLDAERCVRSR